MSPEMAGVPPHSYGGKRGQKVAKTSDSAENAPSAGPSQEDESTPEVETVTPASLNKDKQLSELLRNFTDSPGDDLWQQEEDGAIESAAGRQPSLGKPFLIPDFVTKAAQSSADDAVEQEVGRQGGAQLILRQGRKALQGEDCQTLGLSLGQVRCLQRWREFTCSLPEQVTLPQYISANARIMAKLIADGRQR